MTHVNARAHAHEAVDAVDLPGSVVEVVMQVEAVAMLVVATVGMHQVVAERVVVALTGAEAVYPMVQEVLREAVVVVGDEGEGGNPWGGNEHSRTEEIRASLTP